MSEHLTEPLSGPIAERVLTTEAGAPVADNQNAAQAGVGARC